MLNKVEDIKRDLSTIQQDIPTLKMSVEKLKGIEKDMMNIKKDNTEDDNLNEYKQYLREKRTSSVGKYKN